MFRGEASSSGSTERTRSGVWVYKTAFYLRTDGFGNQSLSPLPGFLKSFLQPLTLDSGVTSSPRPPIGSLPELLLGKTLPVSPSPEPPEDGAGERAVKGREVLAEGLKCQTQRPVPLTSSQQVALLVPTGPRDSGSFHLPTLDEAFVGVRHPHLPGHPPQQKSRGQLLGSRVGHGHCRHRWAVVDGWPRRLGCTWPPTPCVWRSPSCPRQHWRQSSGQWPLPRFHKQSRPCDPLTCHVLDVARVPPAAGPSSLSAADCPHNKPVLEAEGSVLSSSV